MATLPTPGSDSDAWGTKLNTFLQVAHNAGGSLMNMLPVFNVKDDAYGAHVDGTTDDVTHINTAITAAGAAGGGFVVIPGLSALSAPLTMSSPNVILVAVGPGSGIKALAGFSDSAMITITADKCGVRDMCLYGGPNTSSATNPALNGIAITGARYARCENLHGYYINGWMIEGIGGASVNNVGCVMHAIHMTHCAKGIHGKGVTGSNWVGQWFLSNIHPETIDTGDGLFLEDLNDIEITNLHGAVAGDSTSGSMLHIKGNCSAIFVTNVDIGAITQSTVSPACLIETSTNGSPSNIVVNGGVIQKGSQNILVTDGSNIHIKDVTFKSPNTDNAVISGGTVATPLIFDGCVFQTGNQSGGTAYDINLTHSTGYSYVRNCHFLSPVAAATPGSVTNPANDTNHRGYFTHTHFSGTNTTPSTVFAGSPQIVRGCPGYNPRGSITAGTIGASPATVSTSQNDLLIFWLTNCANISGITVGGTSVAIPTNGTVWHVPARQTIVITWSTAAPTWQWIAD